MKGKHSAELAVGFRDLDVRKEVDDFTVTVCLRLFNEAVINTLVISLKCSFSVFLWIMHRYVCNLSEVCRLCG